MIVCLDPEPGSLDPEPGSFLAGVSSEIAQTTLKCWQILPSLRDRNRGQGNGMARQRWDCPDVGLEVHCTRHLPSQTNFLHLLRDWRIQRSKLEMCPRHIQHENMSCEPCIACACSSLYCSPRVYPPPRAASISFTTRLSKSAFGSPAGRSRLTRACFLEPWCKAIREPTPRLPSSKGASSQRRKR